MSKFVIRILNGQELGKEQFIEYFESKVYKTIRQYELLGKKEHIGVGVSGGKDSLTVLKLLKRLSDENPNISIVAIAINEGIEAYRPKTLETSKAFCKENNIELHIYSYEEEFGMPLDEILKVLDVKPCAICGVFRRYLLNKKAKELGCTKLATGHNLDDEAQSIVMNQFKNNIQSSARLGPKSGVAENKHFVQRIKPLYLCTEKEVTTYAFLTKLLDEFIECPNVAKSYRAQIRDMLNDFEVKSPGTKYGIVNSFLQTLPLLRKEFKEAELGTCKQCGEAAAKDLCKACEYVEKLENVKVVTSE